MGKPRSPRAGYRAGHEYPTNCCLVWEKKNGPLIPGSDQPGFEMPQHVRLDRVPSRIQENRIKYAAEYVYGGAYEPAQKHGGAVHSILLAILPGFTSDERFEAIFAEASAIPEKSAASPAPSAKPRTLRNREGKALADIRSGKRGVTVTVPARAAEGFDRWLDAHAEELLQEIHDRWQKTRA